MFLKDYWYVAAWSHEVGREPSARRILDVPVLMYRQEDGVATAMDDRCPHRRAPLSMGRILGDDVECGYHGMRFGPGGACTHIPGQEKIQAAAKTPAFPLVERHGFLWIWIGNEEMADREQVIHFWPPTYCFLEMNVRPAGATDPKENRRMVVLSPITPETEKSHHQFLCFYRNFELDNEELTKTMMDEIHRTALEDTEMLEAQQRNMDADPPGFTPINLRVDQGPIAARRMIETLLAEP